MLLLQQMGFDTSVLLPVDQTGCEYAGFDDPFVGLMPPTPAPSEDSCPPPGFHSFEPFLNLTQWATNPLNGNISWFAQQQMPISYLPREDFYCVATTYTLVSPVGDKSDALQINRLR